MGLLRGFASCWGGAGGMKLELHPCSPFSPFPRFPLLFRPAERSRRRRRGVRRLMERRCVGAGGGVGVASRAGIGIGSDSAAISIRSSGKDGARVGRDLDPVVSLAPDRFFRGSSGVLESKAPHPFPAVAGNLQFGHLARKSRQLDGRPAVFHQLRSYESQLLLFPHSLSRGLSPPLLPSEPAFVTRIRRRGGEPWPASFPATSSGTWNCRSTLSR